MMTLRDNHVQSDIKPPNMLRIMCVLVSNLYIYSFLTDDVIKRHNWCAY
jgi:hypothetical protein